MGQGERTVRFDHELGIEAYRFKGIKQKFPNHFHEYYVIGLIESGQRRLSCRNKTYIVGTGDIVFFNPLDNHICEQVGDQTFDYRCLNIKAEIMQRTVLDTLGNGYLPEFTVPVAYRSKQASLLRELHQMIMKERAEFKKKEAFYFLIEQLIYEYTKPAGLSGPETVNQDIWVVCQYLENNYAEHISLDDLAHLSEMNKYSLLRSFTRTNGITPYRYLKTVRINRAKKLLEQGVEPIEAAMQTGFADQSHFTNFFKNFIGLTPGQYREVFTGGDK